MTRVRLERDGLFWDARAEGCILTTRFGKTTETGRVVLREFDTSEAVIDALAHAVRQKRSQGFEPVDAASEGGRRVGSNPTLEEQLHDRPDDLETWQVYVDWLLTQGTGEARAKLAAIELEVARDPSRASALVQTITAQRTQLDRSGGGLASENRPRFGFARTLRLPGLPRDPDAWRFVSTITIRAGYDIEFQAEVDRLFEHPPRGLRTFEMRMNWPEDTELSWIEAGRFTLFEPCPRLERVVLEGSGIRLGPVEAPRLETLRLVSAGLSSQPIQQIVSGTLPSLRHLELWIGNRDTAGESLATLDDLDPLLRAPPPELRHLGVRNCMFADELPDRIASSPLHSRLHSLDLSLGALTDEGAARLVAHADTLNPIALDVSECTLGADAVRALIAAYPTIRAGRQRAVDPDDDDRYVAVGE